ncbi:MAG TPA: DNA recombination protein RmuC [Gammaproteobacteria bacterium]|nr:DNA recombination protein RmuC [Gammaproteobacteria bacterium]
MPRSETSLSHYLINFAASYADNAAAWLLLILLCLLLIGFGALLVQWRAQRIITTLKERNAELSVTLQLERRSHAEKIASQRADRVQLNHAFNSLASRALRHNNETFLKLARENLHQFQLQASNELAQKEQAVENLVNPIKKALEKTEQQLRQMENERKEAYGALNKHLETLTRSQQMLQDETRNLVQALRRPEVRGQWGELTLKRLVELAGMVEHCDFYQQEHTETGDGIIRPDMIIRMPDSREVVVDVKTPLDAYLSASEAHDDDSRQRHLVRHARKVRERVRELAAKAYWEQFRDAPDFVVLFIPGEQFLSAALDIDNKLLEDALAQKVILATPTSFVALLRAIGYGWRQEQLAENAEHIRNVGEDLYKRLLTLTDYLTRLGRSLENSVSQYNKLVGSFDSRILPGARKFTEMGIDTGKKLESAQQIEKGVRTLDNERKAGE